MKKHKKKRANTPPEPAYVMRDLLYFLKDCGHFKNFWGVETDDDGRITSVGWIDVGMFLKKAYGDEGEKLWAVTHDDTITVRNAETLWKSFPSRGPGVDFETLLKALHGERI